MPQPVETDPDQVGLRAQLSEPVPHGVGSEAPLVVDVPREHPLAKGSSLCPTTPGSFAGPPQFDSGPTEGEPADPLGLGRTDLFPETPRSMVSTLPSGSLNLSAAISPRRAPESAASLVSSRTCSALWSDFREPSEPSNAASAFPTNTSDKRSRARTSCLGTCMRVPGRGGPRMSRSGFRSMIDSAWAQPMAERSTRERPETTDTPAPESRHRAMITRTTSGRTVATRRPARGSALNALTFDRTPTQVEGRQSRAGHTPTPRATPRRSGTVPPGGSTGTRRTGRPVHGVAPRRLRVLRGTRTTAGRCGRTPGRPPRRHGSRTRQGASPATIPRPRRPSGHK